jgi:hypothetical protein
MDLSMLFNELLPPKPEVYWDHCRLKYMGMDYTCFCISYSQHSRAAITMFYMRIEIEKRHVLF